MLYVKTRLGPSVIHGTGIFADQFIRQGQLVWKLEPRVDVAIRRRDIDILPEPARAYIRWFGYLNEVTDEYVLCFDNAKYFNHSPVPNTRSAVVEGDSELVDIAARNIQPGEELTTDYWEFDADAGAKLGRDAPDRGMLFQNEGLDKAPDHVGTV